MLVLMLPVFAPQLYAQGGHAKDNVLFPKPIPIPFYIGLEAGYGNWTDKGYFGVGDGTYAPCALFDNGSGHGYTFGAKAMYYFNTWLFLSPRVRYEGRPGTFKTTLPGDPVRDANDSIVTLRENGEVRANFATCAADLNVGVEFFKTGIYVFGGGSGGLLLDGYYDYYQSIADGQAFTYGDSKGTSHKLISGRSFPTYKRTTFALRGGAGFLLKIGRVIVNPEFFYSSPLNSVLGSPEEMKQTGIVGTMGIMYNFGD